MNLVLAFFGRQEFLSFLSLVARGRNNFFPIFAADVVARAPRPAVNFAGGRRTKPEACRRRVFVDGKRSGNGQDTRQVLENECPLCHKLSVSF